MMEGKGRIGASLTRRPVTPSDMEAHIKGGIVRSVFLDREYSAISSDRETDEIHRFRSRYRANTYVILPVKAVPSEDGSLFPAVRVEEYGGDSPRGFIAVSKHDIRECSPEMRKAGKDERKAYGLTLCREFLSRLNMLLAGRMYRATIRSASGETLDEWDDAVPLREMTERILERMNGLTEGGEGHE